MTKEQFYRNCMTEEGQEENNKEFTNLQTLQRYYKKDIDINDFTQWKEIVYLSKYAKTQLEDENTGEVTEDYGEIKQQQDWEIYTLWDILDIAIYYYEKIYKTPQNIAKYIIIAKNIYNRLDGNNLDDIIQGAGKDLEQPT